MSYQRARERQSRQDGYNSSELGTVTSSGQEINALGLGEYRGVPLIAPFGIRWNPPSGIGAQLIKNWHSGQSVVAIGTIVDEEVPPGQIELYSIGRATVKCKEDGEIEAYSQGGAKLQLKNDGTVVVNDKVTIDSDGKIKAPNIEIAQNMGINSDGDVIINNVVITRDGSIKVPKNIDVGQEIKAGNITIDNYAQMDTANVTGIITATDFIKR